MVKINKNNSNNIITRRYINIIYNIKILKSKTISKLCIVGI